MRSCGGDASGCDALFQSCTVAEVHGTGIPRVADKKATPRIAVRKSHAAKLSVCSRPNFRNSRGFASVQSVAARVLIKAYQRKLRGTRYA